MDAWKTAFIGRLQRATGDPRDPAKSERKLCTYNTHFSPGGLCSFKQLPAHLSAGADLPPGVVRDVSRFRLSRHKLAVECGRYYNMRRQDRTCRRCVADGVPQPHVDDERHMAFECPRLQQLRCSERFSPLFQGLPDGDLRGLMCRQNSILMANNISCCMREVDRDHDNVRAQRT